MQSLGLDPDDPLVRAAVFGVHVQEWIKSDVGTYVMDMVRKRLRILDGKLKTVDCAQAHAVLRLQVEIKHWEDFAGWLGDAIQAGANAQEIIEGEQLAHTEDG